MDRYRRYISFIWLNIWLVSVGAVGAAERQTSVRVLDQSGLEGISGIVLLVIPGNARMSQAFVTDAQGVTTIFNLQCNVCTISAFDPKGNFASRTTEFSGQSPSITLTMQLNPIIDTIGNPSAVPIDLQIETAEAALAEQQDIVIRPSILTLGTNWRFTLRTNSKGHLSVDLPPGQYTAATIIGKRPLEAKFQVSIAKSKCIKEAGPCLIVVPRAPRHTYSLSLRLSISDAGQQ